MWCRKSHDSVEMPRKTRRTRRVRRSRKTRHGRRSQKSYQKGGLIETYAALFDSYFGTDWILTGSEAVRLLAEHFGIGHTIAPSDLDVLVVSKDMFYRDRIGSFVRTVDTPMRSMTFQDPAGRSFDLMTVPKETYVVVPYQGIPVRVKYPAGLLQDYKSELATRGNKQNADWIKIFVLEQVLMRSDLPPTVLDTRVRRNRSMNAMNVNNVPVPVSRGPLSFATPPTTPTKPMRSIGQWGGLGRIPSTAIVDIQADPYSARTLVDAETAENILAARE